MTKKQILLASALIMTGMFSCKQKEYTKLKSGLEYMIVKDEKGDKKPTEGSIVSVHILTKIGDSTLFDSRKNNNNEPVPAQIAKPQYNGDLMEGLMMLTEGDSALFRVSADSIFRNGQMPPFVKKGDTVQFFVKMVSVKSMEDFQKEEEASAKKQITSDEEVIKKYLVDNKITATKTASGLYYSITQAGSGENAKAGQEVSMYYTGKLLDGTTFDSNQDPKFGHTEPFKFPLGAGQVIKGWDEGIALLNKGAKAKLIIPSPLGYGTRGMPGNPNNEKGIPANSILVFDVEMLGAKDMAAK
ncbi:MAG: FKBP-type peptidyl-prolyl cis-trans isomerase [Chitinophagaceae bacterium]|nr:FKBP-type peptidyl-prolyl cis-trans isomerase [Chitinophagaceae bacterium]